MSYTPHPADTQYREAGENCTARACLFVRQGSILKLLRVVYNSSPTIAFVMASTYSPSLQYAHTPSASTSSSTMSRPAYSEAFLVASTPRYCDVRSQVDDASEPIDLSLFSTVLLVVTLAVGGAFFIMAVACFLGDDHNTGVYLFSSLFPANTDHIS